MFADFVSDLILKYRYKMVLEGVVLFKPRAHAFDYHINLKPSVFSTITRNIECGSLGCNGPTLLSKLMIFKGDEWQHPR